MRLSVIQYAKLAGISKATAYRYVKSKRVRTERNNGVTYVILDDADLKSLDETKETERDFDEKMRLQEEINDLREHIKDLNTELGNKNDQIAELHQLLGMAQKNVGTLTDQLTSAHAQLEDLRKPRPWWQRVFGQVT